MERIRFIVEKQVASFANPLKGNQIDNQEIEVRYDPLLGHQSVFNPDLKDKVSILFPPTDERYLKKVVEESKSNCFLCDQRWKKTTPRYPDSLIPGGRLIKNDVVLFPNLFPLFGYHAVVMLGNEHYRSLEDFPVSLVNDALDVCIEFIERCFHQDDGARYFTINANYLFPAGSSVVHPHLQIIGGSIPTTHQRQLIDSSRGYQEKHGTTYWEDLVEVEEKVAERWIGKISRSAWIASFSPVGQNEINAIWPEKKHFLQWDRDDIRSAAAGISTVLRSYKEMGHSTFNFSLFSGSLNGSDDGFRCMLRIITRQNVVPNHRTDDYYFQKLLKNEIILIPPEVLAGRVKESLKEAFKSR